MQRNELEVVNERSPLTQHQVESGRVYIPTYGRLFIQPATLLHQINQMTLLFDFALGIAACAKESFDQYLQSRTSLPLLIPLYAFAVLIVPLCYVVGRSKKPTQAIELKMPVEDRWLMNELSQAVRDQVIAIKEERLKKKAHVELGVNLPTFLLSLSLHLTYCFMLGAQKDEKTQANFFVENFDWLAPALIAGMMTGLAVLGKYCYRQSAEKSFARQLGLN